MVNPDLVEQAVSAVLELAGVPESVVTIIEAEIVSLADWIGAELAGQRDPVAQLSALMGTAETAAKALEDAELPK